MTGYWFPAYGHPDGPSDAAWYRLDGEWVYQAGGHPEGESDDACFRIVAGRVYPTLPSSDSAFEIIGAFVYPLDGSGPPWFGLQPPRGRSTSRHPSVG